MQKCSIALRKHSQVPTRETVPLSSLTYHSRYSIPRKMTLSRNFDTVKDSNRFISLSLILEKLSGYIGRRQYKMQCNIHSYFSTFERLGLDWQDLKMLNFNDLNQVINNELQLGHSERAVLLTALHHKSCGVLTRSSTRHSTQVCMRRGLPEHGWRCGQQGHTTDVYFEGKECSNAALRHVHQRPYFLTVKRWGIENKIYRQPDFSVVGRFEHQANPRIWNSPQNPNFTVDCIGFEFRVHPDDPRALPQIEEAANDWYLHAEVTKQIICEVLESRAIERDRQPLSLQSGEMGVADIPSSYSSIFSFETNEDRESVADGAKPAVVEHRMISKDGAERPWFQAPLAQQFEKGVPLILPFAPSLIIKSTFRRIQRSSDPGNEAKLILQPLMDISCFVHPAACFAWNKDDEERCVSQIVEYAKRIPFALPFNLYYRIDPTRYSRLNPGYEKRKELMMKEKSDFFDLRNFRNKRAQ